MRSGLIIAVEGVLIPGAGGTLEAGSTLAAENLALAPGAGTMIQRLNLAKVVIVLVAARDYADDLETALELCGARSDFTSIRPAGWTPRLILGLMRTADLDPATTWLCTCDDAAIDAAGSAGLAGVVLVGIDPPPGDHQCVVARAESLADAPRVMLPRGGGCWHTHQT